MSLTYPSQELLLSVREVSTQVKEYGTVPAGIYRKSPEHGSSIPAGKFSDFFWCIPITFLCFPARNWSETTGKNPEIFRPEYCFHVPMTSGVFLQDPAFFPSLFCRFLRDLVTGIFDLGNVDVDNIGILSEKFEFWSLL